ncbi:MAG: hypothetical protein R2753_06675 [Chitinophagales bacterium]
MALGKTKEERQANRQERRENRQERRADRKEKRQQKKENRQAKKEEKKQGKQENQETTQAEESENQEVSQQNEAQSQEQTSSQQQSNENETADAVAASCPNVAEGYEIPDGCKYTEVNFTVDGGSKMLVYQEVATMQSSEKFDRVVVIAGENGNTKKLQVTIDGLDTAECPMDHAEKYWGFKAITGSSLVDMVEGSPTANPVKIDLKYDYGELIAFPFSYFKLLKKAQTYQLNAITCTLDKPVNIEVYPDLKWGIAAEFKFNITNYGHTNMEPGPIFSKHQEQARKGGYERWLINLQGGYEFSIGIGVRAEWDDERSKREFTAAFKSKWGVFVRKVIKITEVGSKVTNFIRGAAESTSIPTSFDFRYPIIELVLSKQLTASKDNTSVVNQFEFSFGAKPLMGAEVNVDIIDLIVQGLSYGITGTPAIAKIFKAFKKGMEYLGGTFDFFGTIYGQLELEFKNVTYDSINGFNLKGTLAIGGEMGLEFSLTLKAGGEIKALGYTAQAEIEATANAHGAFGGTVEFGNDDDGLFIQAIGKFSGVIFEAEIKGEVGWWESTFLKINEILVPKEEWPSPKWHPFK